MNKYFRKGKKIIFFYITQNLVFVLQEQFLKKFPSNNIYKRLNNEVVTTEYDKYCTNIKRLSSNNQGIYQLCRIFARNLKEISKILNETTNNIDRCRYFNFWKNEQINKIHNTSSNTNAIQYIRTRFFSVSSIIKGDSSIHECFNIYRSDISMELWKQWKDLYDYIKNKKDIQNIINSDNKLCEIYPKYHTYITGIYKTYKKECCEGYNGNCPHEINFSEWCKQEDILTELTCNKSSEAPVSSAESGQVIATNLKVSDGEEKIDEGQENAESEGLTQRGPKGEELGPQLTGDMQTENGPRGLVETKMLQTAGRRDLKGDDLMFTPNDANSHEAVIPNKVGTIGATVAGSSLFLLMMYKYTPLGSWVSTKILGRNKLMENMKKNNYELLLNDVANRDASLNNPMYHISYNSATNH